MKRKFYKTTLTIEILSDSPDGADFDLPDLPDASVDVKSEETKEVDGPTRAKLLIEQRSDPRFLGLDEEGNDVDEEDYL